MDKKEFICAALFSLILGVGILIGGFSLLELVF
jgi:hypothetical protein